MIWILIRFAICNYFFLYVFVFFNWRYLHIWQYLAPKYVKWLKRKWFSQECIIFYRLFYGSYLIIYRIILIIMCTTSFKQKMVYKVIRWCAIALHWINICYQSILQNQLEVDDCMFCFFRWLIRHLYAKKNQTDVWHPEHHFMIMYIYKY